MKFVRLFNITKINSELIPSAFGRFFLKIFSSLILFANGVLFARFLGVEGFGVYSIHMATINVFSIFLTLGLPSLLTREIAIFYTEEKWDLMKGVIVSGYKWILKASVIFILLLLAALLLFFKESNSFYSLLLIGVLSPVLALNITRAAMLRGMKWVVLGDLPELIVLPVVVLLILLFLLLLKLNFNVAEAMFIQLVGGVCALVLGIIFLRKKIPGEVHAINKISHKSSWLNSAYIYLAVSLVSMIGNQAPLYMLGVYGQPDQAGLYQAANQIVNLIVIGLVAINLPLQPRLAVAWSKGDVKTSQKLVTETVRVGTVFAIVVVVFLMLFSNWIFKLYGFEFMPAEDILKILLVSQVINAIFGSCGLVLAMTGNQVFALYGLLISLVVTILFSLVLIPRFGAIGAAWSNLVGMFVWNLMLTIMARKQTTLLTFIH